MERVWVNQYACSVPRGLVYHFDHYLHPLPSHQLDRPSSRSPESSWLESQPMGYSQEMGEISAGSTEQLPIHSERRNERNSWSSWIIHDRVQTPGLSEHNLFRHLRIISSFERKVRQKVFFIRDSRLSGCSVIKRSNKLQSFPVIADVRQCIGQGQIRDLNQGEDCGKAFDCILPSQRPGTGGITS